MNINSGILLLVVLFINVFAFLAQAGIDTVLDTEAPDYFTYEGSLISEYDAGNYTIKPFSADEMPSNEASINNEGGLFTDIFVTLKNWILDVPGVRHLIAVVDAVPNFLQQLRLPVELAYAIAFLWHVLAVYLIVDFIRG